MGTAIARKRRRTGESRMRGTASAGNDHLQPPHPRVGAVLAHQLGIAVGAHHPHLVANPGLGSEPVHGLPESGHTSP